MYRMDVLHLQGISSSDSPPRTRRPHTRLGYSSAYLTEVCGQGLIPETFADYRKQRFRWTYGPVGCRSHVPEH